MQDPREPLFTTPSADAAPSVDRSWERRTLEELAFATLHEQKTARRWKVGLRVAWLVLFAVVFWQAFSLNSPTNHPSLPHTAMVSIVGEIGSEPKPVQKMSCLPCAWPWKTPALRPWSC